MSSSSSTSASASTSKSAMQEFPVDPSSPLFVTAAVLASGAGGGLVGATIGYAKQLYPLQMGVNMSINCSVASLAFFGTREYLVSPILLGMKATPSHERRAAILRGEDVLENQSIRDVRLERVLDSAIAGAASGGGLSLLARGPRTVFPAAFTASLIASIAQIGVNQARVFRLEMLAKQARGPQPVAVPREPRIEAVQSFEEPRKAEDAIRGDAVITGKVLGVLSKFLPVKRLTDEEYLERLETKRKQVDVRLKEIEEEQLAMFQNIQQ